MKTAAEGVTPNQMMAKGAQARPGIGRNTRTTHEGDANGAPHPDPAAYAKRFTGKYEHRLFKGGIGHNPPQEAPVEFAKAVIDVDKL